MITSQKWPYRQIWNLWQAYLKTIFIFPEKKMTAFNISITFATNISKTDSDGLDKIVIIFIPVKACTQNLKTIYKRSKQWSHKFW